MTINLARESTPHRNVNGTANTSHRSNALSNPLSPQGFFLFHPPDERASTPYKTGREQIVSVYTGILPVLMRLSKPKHKPINMAYTRSNFAPICTPEIYMQYALEACEGKNPTQQKRTISSWIKGQENWVVELSDQLATSLQRDGKDYFWLHGQIFTPRHIRLEQVYLNRLRALRQVMGK